MPDIAQNVLLYVPFGIFGAWLLREIPWSRAALFFALMVLALAYSATMELLQRMLASRIPSLLDVIANVGGTAAGAVMATPVEQALARASASLRRTGFFDGSARYAFAVILVTIIVAAWYPFDVTLDVSTLGERTRAFRRDPWLWPSAATLLAQGASFALLAVITVLCVPKLRKLSAPVAIAFALVTAVVVDLGQLGMGSQPIGLAGLSSQSAGACVGAAAGAIVMFVRGTEYVAA